MEKPLSFEDYKNLKLTSYQKTANCIIKQLNEAIRRKTRSLNNWSQDPERVEVLAIVAREFKKAGWEGVVQRKNQNTNNYKIILIPPGCTCFTREDCNICKGDV